MKRASAALRGGSDETGTGVMAECENCGSSDLVPGHAPWWLDRVNAWFFRAARCGNCGEFVHGGTGERIGPLCWGTTARVVLAAPLITALTVAGPVIGGRPGWWFAGSFAAWAAGLGLTLHRLRNRGRRTRAEERSG